MVDTKLDLPIAIDASPSLNHLVIFGMRSDPEPDAIIAVRYGESPVSNADASRPVRSDSLEVQRWMSGILLEQFEICIGKIAHALGQAFISFPE